MQTYSPRILLTGAAGFIGSHVLESLLDEGAIVTAIDNFDPFYARDLKCSNVKRARTNPNLTFIEGDICSTEDVRRISQPYDAIIHLAAKAGVRPSIADPLAYERVNVAGTQNLLELARRCGVAQFVFASSSSVYGVNPNTPWSEADCVLQPISPYAATKVSGELLGHVYSHLYGIRFVALRFFTVYGPRQRPDLAIRKFSEMMLRGEPIPYFGDGSTSRDYTFIDDIVQGIRAAVGYAGSRYEVINLGNDRTVSLAEMVHTLEGVLGIQAIIEPRPQQPGDVPRTWADIAKAGNLLQYRPRTSFQEGIAKFAAWLNGHRDHREGSLTLHHDLPVAKADAGRVVPSEVKVT